MRRDTETPDTASRWIRRPRLASMSRSLLGLAPLVITTAFVFLASVYVVPADVSLPELLAWWVAIGAASFGSLFVVGHLARRLMPLAALLEMSLIFPDRVPSRFRVALSTLSTNSLDRKLAQRQSLHAEETQDLAAHELLGLVSQLAFHDRSTRGHCERVRAYSQMIADELGMSRHEREKLNWAALLHDVGKLVVPAEVLNKTGGLSDEEFALIKSHPEEGARIAEPLRKWLGESFNAIAQHHERWDGTGYPKGLKGNEISRAGRIVALADAFDVMTSARSYKSADSVDAARRELVDCSKGQFDPDVVRAFLSVSIGLLQSRMPHSSWVGFIPLIGRLPIGQAVTPGLASLGAAAALVALPAAGLGLVAKAPDVERPTATSLSTGPSAASQAGAGSLTAPPSGPGVRTRPTTPAQPDADAKAPSVGTNPKESAPSRPVTSPGDTSRPSSPPGLEVPDVTETPGLPGLPELPAVPSLPAVPDLPVLPDLPEPPQPPSVPVVPEVPEVTAPEAPVPSVSEPNATTGQIPPIAVAERPSGAGLPGGEAIP